jgi:FixJ family two-component response regulator
MVMPGNITGATLARTLAENCEELKVILTSGYSPEIVSQDSPLIPGAVFLPKPYGPKELLAAIQSAHDTEPESASPEEEMELTGVECS